MRHSLWSQHVSWNMPFIQKPQPEDLVVSWGLSTGQNPDTEGKGGLLAA